MMNTHVPTELQVTTGLEGTALFRCGWGAGCLGRLVSESFLVIALSRSSDSSLTKAVSCHLSAPSECEPKAV